jgi:basic membrane protein A
MKKAFGLIVLAVLLVFGFSYASNADNGKIKAAFLLVGPHNDGGWSQSHNDGRIYLEKHLPYVETAYSETVPEGAPCEKIIRDYIHKGYKVIFGTSFGFMDSMYNVAKDYPDVIFEHCSGYKTRKNMGTYFGRMYQADYLSGLVAGMMTKSNYIGFVAPFPIPEVIREINSFTIGAREVNPKVEVHVIWTNSWFNPVKERSAANTFVANKADIIASGCDSPASLEGAKKAHVYAIGYDRDNVDKFPNTILTSRVWHWGVFYTKALKEIKNGTWTSKPYWGGLKDGVMGLGKFGNKVPQKVKDYVLKRQKEIIDGKFKVFAGPIYDNKGKLRVKKGQELKDQEKLSMQWFVKGVVGTIPNK